MVGETVVVGVLAALVLSQIAIGTAFLEYAETRDRCDNIHVWTENSGSVTRDDFNFYQGTCKKYFDNPFSGTGTIAPDAEDKV